ncbi:hypothetical protein CRE_29721 [Caenorhabditis remanei]|uniref:Uncharacterized protein n=1 Tax=Caenorhabditis remanei TaxID=31234 RepID=E3LVD6_CAERE|nr:hypothetical protein CRE_29721 [Caenorhabditis remanei]
MSHLLIANQNQSAFSSDLHNDWSGSVNCAWSNTVQHSNELYDLHGVGTVKNVLCLRLFASSIYEIANASKDGRKLMTAIFGEQLIRNIAEYDVQIYESIAQTVQYLAWKIRKSQILLFRRTSENHGWLSVREILVRILSNDNETHGKIIAGMSATILQDIHRSHVSRTNFREDFPLLPKNRFHDVFRVAFVLFNSTIGEYIQKGKKEVVYEMIASRLVYFYTRLAADTWRILVVRNGPKVETEWYMLRGVEDVEVDTRSSNRHQLTNTSSYNNNNNNSKTYNLNLSPAISQIHHANFMKQFTNQRPLMRKPLQ